MQLIDTHAHLDSIDDIDGALKRAEESGVPAVIAVGEGKESNIKNLEIQKRTEKPRVCVGIGIHPSVVSSQDFDENLEITFIEEHIGQAVAVAEIGLDFWYKWVRKDQGLKDRQRRVYRKLLAIGRDNHLTVVVHTRGAWREAFDIAHEEKIERAVFHWYSGPEDVLKDIIEAGYFISVAPSVAYSPEHRRAAQIAPLERILLETDSPVYYRKCDEGFAAQPADVFRTLRHFSLLRGINQDEVAQQVNANAREIFQL